MISSNNKKKLKNNMTEEVNVKDQPKAKGFVNIYAFDSKVIPDYRTYLIAKNNNLLDKFTIEKFGKHNTITIKGFNVIPVLMVGGEDTVTHCGVGTGTPGAVALGTEVGTRVAVTYKYAINNEYHVDTFYGKNDPNTSSNDLTEAGLFSASSSGDMYSSNTISFTKDTTKTLLIAWAWSFA